MFLVIFVNLCRDKYVHGLLASMSLSAERVKVSPGGVRDRTLTFYSGQSSTDRPGTEAGFPAVVGLCTSAGWRRGSKAPWGTGFVLVSPRLSSSLFFSNGGVVGRQTAVVRYVMNAQKLLLNTLHLKT